MESADTITRFTKYYAQNRPFIQRVLTFGFIAYIVAGSASGFVSHPRKPPKAKDVSSESPQKHPSRLRAIDPDFYTRLSRLLRIVIPSLHSKEALMLAIHSSLLIFRTILSLYVASLDGKIVAALVRVQPVPFVWNLLRWLIVAIPATWTNAWLSYIQNKLAIAYRTRLTRKLTEKYLGDSDSNQEKLYYKMTNLDDRVHNPDQMITVDVQNFTTHLAAVYSNLAKPVLDVALYNYQLSQNVGAEGLILLTGLVQASAACLRLLTPPFGKYTAHEAALSGNFRQVHSRLSEFAEEVSFFDGEATEKLLAEKSYFEVVKHVNRVLRIRVWHGILEEGIIKWLWGSFGLCVCALPIFFKIPGIDMVDLGSRTEGFVTNRRLLLSASDAFGRVMYSYKELSELAGYTSRVSELLETLEAIDTGRLQKNLLTSASGHARKLMASRGKVIEADRIEFQEVPIITPNGDILVESLSFYVDPGQHLLIVGPNGCGKSSLFRILGGLWPVYGGVVRKPPASAFMLIPQRPYLSLGTMRDQVIYPHSKAQMHSRGYTDDDLRKILSLVQLDHIIDQPADWDITREWRDALSGGDKQKMAWARLFYHTPKYAILDEATSLVPVELEGAMMDHATSVGITLLTVSHRPSLWKYHSMILHYDGSGGYVFTKLDAERRLAMQEERQALETKLLDVPKMKARLAELKVAKNQ